MTDFEKLDASEPKGISRRTMVKGAAWAVPVIAVASATPAFASSHECEPVFTFGGTSCKCPGDDEYFLQFCVTDANNCGGDTGTPATTLYIWGVESGSGSQLVPDGSFPIAIPLVNGQGCSDTIHFTSDTSANFLYVFYNFDAENSTPNTRFPSGNQGIPAPPNCAPGSCPS